MSTPKRFRFTNQLIKSLPPNTSDARSTDAEYSDTEISGLKCLVSRREGRKKFLLRYLYHGRKRAIAIGHWPEVDVNLARQIAIEHKRSLATGTDPKQERENKRMELTFDELFNQHYLPWAKSAKRSWEGCSALPRSYPSRHWSEAAERYHTSEHSAPSADVKYFPVSGYL